MTESSKLRRCETLRFGAGLGLLALALALAPGAEAAPTVEQARAKLAAGQVREAAGLAESAIRRSPRNPQAHVVFGSVLLLQGKAAEAARSFEFALALDPDVRGEVGQAYVAAVRHFAAASQPDAAETHLAKALEHDVALQGPAIGALFGDALERFRAGEASGADLLARWGARFPDYSPGAEEDLFTLASYHEAQGRRAEAASLYARCAEEFPEGDLGGRAAEILRPRRAVFERRLSVSCSDRLFAELLSLELGYDSTIAELSLVWVSADRAAAPSTTLHLLPETRIETPEGERLPLPAPQGAAKSPSRRIVLPSDIEQRVMLTLSPIPPDLERVSVLVENDVCGTTGRRGRHTLEFKGLPLGTALAAGGTGAAEDPDRELVIPVFHLHDYFVTTGHCDGTLHLSRRGIAYRSDWHAFEVPCEEVARLTEGWESVADPLQRFGQSGVVPTLLVEGPGLTRRGKAKTMTWQFLAADRTPPVLLLAKSPCRSGR